MQVKFDTFSMSEKNLCNPPDLKGAVNFSKCLCLGDYTGERIIVIFPRPFGKLNFTFYSNLWQPELVNFSCQNQQGGRVPQFTRGVLVDAGILHPDGFRLSYSLSHSLSLLSLLYSGTLPPRGLRMFYTPAPYPL